jgi:PPOX class probable F420-dependent enzyme
MSYTMTDDERRAFLTEGTRTAKVATTRADGRPHAAPVWFVLDGDDVIFTTGEGTVKGRTLRRDPRVSVVVDSDKPPFAFVVIDGVAEISHDQAELLRWATALGARYMGADRAEEFGRRNAAPEELLVRVRPSHVVAIGGMTD